MDRICIKSILKTYLNPETVKEGYAYSQSKIYYPPADGDIQVYRDYIKNLPLNDLPEIFGMHENANISYNLKESNSAITTVLDI